MWDEVWNNKYSVERNVYEFNKAKKSAHWIRMKRLLIKEFGSLKGLKSVEIGAGSGMYSLILASEGVNVTVLDYSPKAIEVSKLLFKSNNLKAKFIQEDAFKINKKLPFFLCIFLCLLVTAEHFIGANRLKFIKNLHFVCIEGGGVNFYF